MEPLKPEPLVRTLIDHRVEFIIVGGFAVAAHGHPRATKDIDICPNPDPDNLARLAAALEEIEAVPIGLDEFDAEFELRPNLEGLKNGGNWTLRTAFGRLDVMQFLNGLTAKGGGWAELRPHAIRRQFLGHACLFCGYNDLVAMKSASGRPQDDVDIQGLKAARSDC